MVNYKVNDKITPQASLLHGYTEALYQKVITQRMTSDFAVNEILAEAEKQFFTRDDDKNAPVGFWRGEFWGKWIISAVRACKYQKNEKLEEIVRNSVYKIMATANEDGYIGTYKNSKLILPCTKEEGMKAVGFRCDFCWNIWCQKYTLWGLLEAYELFSDKKILESAEKLANQIVDTVHETGVNPCETGTFYGVASGSIMKPMLILYRHTENKKFLDFAISIADGFENDEAKCIKIIKKSLLGIPVHLWNHDNPIAVGRGMPTSQKAYEMMSCFEGICELYRFTGIEKYLTATKKFFDLLIEYEFNRIFSVGFNDRFLYAASVEDAVSEPCDIVHYMRLAADLYQLTGYTFYLDCYENAFLNPFLASITRDGSWGARAVRSMSHHVLEYNIVDMKYNHCCVNNVPRSFEHASKTAIASSQDGIFVNLYLPLESKCGGDTVVIGEGYTQYCKVDVSLSLDAAKTVSFRIPAWSKKTEICYHGVTYTPDCGGYFAISAVQGKSTVTIQFDQTPRLIKGSYFRDIFPLTPYLSTRYNMHVPAQSTNENKATLCIGPMLLALSVELGTDWETIVNRPSINEVCTECTAKPVAHDGMLCSYEVTFQTKNKTETLPMCDYASASNRFQENDFSIFV